MSRPQKQTTPLTSYQILLIVLFVSMLFTIVLDYMTLPALSAILLPELGITTQEFGLIISAYAFSAGISAFIATGFVDSFDRKNLLLVYYGGFLLGIMLCATAASFLALIVARVITGTFGGVVAAICFAIVADLFQSDQRGRVMGYIQIAFAASLVAGLPFAVYLATHANWHLNYWILFAFGLIICCVLFFNISPINSHLNTLQSDSLLKHSTNIAGNRDYWVVFLNNIFLVLGDAMFMTFGSAYMTSNLGVSLADLPLLYMISGIATIVLSPVIGKLSDKYGKFRFFTIGTGLAITLVLFYSYSESIPFWTVVLANTLLFVGINARMIASSALATVVPVPTERGAFMALDSSFQQLAGGVAATAAGWIVYQTSDGIIHGYPTLGWTVTGVMLATTGLMYIIHLMVDGNS